MLSRPLLSTGLSLALFLLAAAAPATAQTIEVENGGTLELANGGVWNLNGATVDLGGTGSTASIAESGNARFANGKLTATRALNAPNSRDVAGLGAVLTASQNLGATTVTRGHDVQQAPNNNESIARFYDISPSQNNSGLSATLTHHYADPELNGLSESSLELFKSTDGGSTWSEEGQDGRSASNNTVTLNGIASFSRWTLGSTQSPLPVELTAFEATVAKEKTVELTWQTASEQSNAGFHVQHKAGEKEEWAKVGFVESNASGGTATEANRYRFVAEGLAVGTHRFRLKQVDLDGSAHLSDPVVVELEMQQPLRLSAPAPNPARSTATLRFGAKEAQSVEVVLYDVLGRRMKTLFEGSPEAGQMQTMRLRAGDLPAGTYFVRLSADGKTRTRRLTVLR